VVIAGLRKLAASGLIKKDALTVAFITGAGPRTQDIFSDVVQPFTIEPAIEAVEEVVGAVA